MDFLMLILAIGVAYVLGFIFRKINLPEIIGWLLAGIIVGPSVLNILSRSVINNEWYSSLIIMAQMIVGVMIGLNIEWSNIKKVGKKTLYLSLWHILFTFLSVSIGFSILYIFTSGPILVPVVIGLISISCAPAPILAVIKEYNTDGPLSRTTIPMTVMNSLFATAIFFTSISLLESFYSDINIPIISSIVLMLVVPTVVGFVMGWLIAKVLPDDYDGNQAVFTFIGAIVVVIAIFVYINTYIYSKPLINYLLTGMGFAAGFINFTSPQKKSEIRQNFVVIQRFGLLVMIMSLSAPLNPKLLLLGASWAILYTILRLFGSWIGGYIGGKIINAEDSVTKYIGVTMAPHSVVALVNTSVASSALVLIAPDHVPFIQTIIPAAALINEVIAIILSKKVYEWTGETSTITNTAARNIREQTLYETMPRSGRYYIMKAELERRDKIKKNID